MVLKVDPEVLETEATNIESLASQFGADLDTRASAVEGLDWDGATREAFAAMFSETRTQLRDVEEQIANIASTLRSAKDGLIEADTSIGQGISGG
jgi:WXG100 family type VII secretion target